MIAKRIIINTNQNFFDLAIQQHGHVEGIADFLLNNRSFSASSETPPGTRLYYKQEPIDAQTYQYFLKKQYAPATGDSISPSPVPEPGPSGNEVILNYENGAVITLYAPDEFDVPPVSIIDQDSNVLEALSPGQSYEVIVFSGIHDTGPPYTNSIIPA